MRTGLVVILVVMVCVGSAPSVRAQSGEDEAEQYLETARSYQAQGNARMAEIYARKVLELVPGDPAATELLGLATAAGGDTEGTGIPAVAPAEDESTLMERWRNAASDDVRRAAGASLSELWLERAQTLQKKRSPAPAVLLAVRKARAFNGDNPWAHYELFTVLAKLDRLEEAIPAARRFLELQGFGAIATEVRRKLQELQLEIGDRYARDSRWDRASKHYGAVLALDPPRDLDEQARKKLGLAVMTLFHQLHGNGQYVEAAVYLEQLMAIRPADPEGRTAFDAEFTSKVRRYMPSVFLEAAKALRERGRYEPALAYLDRLRETGPSTEQRKQADELRRRIQEEQVGRTGPPPSLGDLAPAGPPPEGDDAPPVVGGEMEP